MTVLKIDRSFVTGLSGNEASMSVVTGIVNLAQGFGLHTVAEGVEDAADLAAVRSLQCDNAQGFLWGQPCAADDFVARYSAGAAQPWARGVGTSALRAAGPR